MLTALILAQAVLATPPAPASRPAASALLPPSDWSSLPALPVARRANTSPAPSAFVREEVTSGRCKANGVPPPGAAVPAVPASGTTLSVELAVLVSSSGQVRRVVPRAIGCAAVEQYATGLALNMVRNLPTLPDGDGWFRTTIDFAW
jgi:hypothetical protein